MESYIDLLPSELFLNIVSYLDYQDEYKTFDQLDVWALMDAYPKRNPNYVQAIQLFNFRYPHLFNREILQKFKINHVYMGLLCLDPLIEYIKIGDIMVPRIGCHYDIKTMASACLYLIYIGWLPVDGHIVARLDRLNLLKAYIRKRHADNLGVYLKTQLKYDFGYFLNHNSYKILEFILSQKEIINIDHQIIIHYAELKEVSFDLTKLIFKYFNKTKTMLKLLLRYRPSDMESYNYIFDLLPETLDETLLGSYIKSINRLNYYQIQCKTFIPLWDKYKHQIPNPHKDVIYQSSIYGCLDEKELMKLVIYLSQDDYITKRYTTKLDGDVSVEMYEKLARKFIDCINLNLHLDNDDLVDDIFEEYSNLDYDEVIKLPFYEITALISECSRCSIIREYYLG